MEWHEICPSRNILKIITDYRKKIFRDGHISCHSTLSFWDTKYNIMYHTVQSSWRGLQYFHSKINLNHLAWSFPCISFFDAISDRVSTIKVHWISLHLAVNVEGFVEVAISTKRQFSEVMMVRSGNTEGLFKMIGPYDTLYYISCPRTIWWSDTKSILLLRKQGIFKKKTTRHVSQRSAVNPEHSAFSKIPQNMKYITNYH